MIKAMKRAILGTLLLLSPVAHAEEEEAVPARAQDLWSLQPLKRPSVPKAGEDWARNPIDRFIAAKLEAAGIKPGPPASPQTLLRRLSFDLHGLPPSLELLQQHPAPSFEKLVPEFLASPRFGERWARYWLDVARFAESDGFEQDFNRPSAWRYRDWVVQALSEDLPFDQFVRWQVAGDRLEPENTNANLATGFLVAGVENSIQSRKDYVQQHYDKIDDMISTVGTAFLGMSFSCARCHDHKYDPFSQREYYDLASTLETTVSQNRDLEGQKAYVAGETKDGRITMLVRTEPHRKNLPSVPAKVHFLERGEASQQKAPADTAFPSALVTTVVPNHWTGQTEAPTHGRIALANWLTDVEFGAGALVARVIVNRFWQHHFGRGLVTTPNNFGSRGAAPTHPELLDWLACELIAREWQLKEIHKLILLSATYQQGYRKGTPSTDPKNTLWWRREPQRLDAEAIRDSFLAVSGRLDLQMAGPGSLDPHQTRRSIYLIKKRSKLIPLMQLFDAPDSLQSEGQRQATTTAPQGLTMLNNPFVIASAKGLADRLANTNLEGDALIERGFLLALGRKPGGEERALCRPLVADRHPDSLRDFSHLLFCLNEFLYVE